MSTLTSEYVAREILATNGETGEPHPALLADTIREVEYHGVEQVAAERGITAPAADAAPVEWEVVKQEWSQPCEHVACDLLHRHLYNAYFGSRTLITVYNMDGEEVGVRHEARYHERTIASWIILHNGERHHESDAYHTKREAVARMDRLRNR